MLKSITMKITILVALFISLTFCSYSQVLDNNPDLNQKGGQINSSKITSKIVELNNVVKGIGPAGNVSIGIASLDMFNKEGAKEELKAYPKMKNLPDSLSNMKQYLYILNDFQFYYQNYKEGIYSKDFFFDKAKGNGRNLKDTLLLSDKKVKNTISIVAGHTADSTMVYIVDSNNNDDYSDEMPKPVLTGFVKQEDVIDNAVKVQVEYYDGNSIKKDTQLIAAENNDDKELSLMFKFPQYRYGKVTFKDKDYLIIAESVGFNSSIYFIRDQPHFQGLDRKYRVNPSGYLKIDNDYIQYFPVSQNSNKVKLIISSENKANNTIPTSNQVNMIAPEVTGINILENEKISLKGYKGKYVFLDFWSTACPPCFAEFPKIKEVYDKFSEKEIAIIGIADVRGNMDMKKFLEDKNVTWPNINEEDSSTIIKGYNINSWPTTYLVDPNGKIIATNLRRNDLDNKLISLKVAKKK